MQQCCKDNLKNTCVLKIIHYLCFINLKLKKMNNVIKSSSGKKEAIIVYTIANGFTAKVLQIINTGINIEKDLIDIKYNFKTYEAAAKYCLKKLN